MEYAFLIYIDNLVNFIKFIEESSELEFSKDESNLYFAWSNCFKLDVKEEDLNKQNKRSFAKYCKETYGININILLYFNMVNNEDVDSLVWGPRTMSLLNNIMKEFSGDCILYTNGFDIPIMVRKNGVTVVDSNEPSSKVFDFAMLDIPYTDMVIDS